MTLISDRAWHACGEWTFASTNQDVSGIPPTSFSTAIEIDDCTGPEATFAATWEFPLPGAGQPAKLAWGVRNYAHAHFGGGMGTKPLVPWPARQVRDMAGMGQSVSYQLNTTGMCNVLAEAYAVPTATEAGRPAGCLELGFHLRPNKDLWSWAQSDGGKVFGTLADAQGQTWTMVAMPMNANRNWWYVMAVATRWLSDTWLPYGDALAFCRDHSNPYTGSRFLTGDEWILGSFFGVEIVNGAGEMRVSSLSGLHPNP
jgi:hypothetical protein